MAGRGCSCTLPIPDGGGAWGGAALTSETPALLTSDPSQAQWHTEQRLSSQASSCRRSGSGDVSRAQGLTHLGPEGPLCGAMQAPLQLVRPKARSRGGPQIVQGDCVPCCNDLCNSPTLARLAPCRECRVLRIAAGSGAHSAFAGLSAATLEGWLQGCADLMSNAARYKEIRSNQALSPPPPPPNLKHREYALPSNSSSLSSACSLAAVSAASLEGELRRNTVRAARSLSLLLSSTVSRALSLAACACS